MKRRLDNVEKLVFQFVKHLPQSHDFEDSFFRNSSNFIYAEVVLSGKEDDQPSGEEDCEMSIVRADIFLSNLSNFADSIFWFVIIF